MSLASRCTAFVNTTSNCSLALATWRSENAKNLSLLPISHAFVTIHDELFPPGDVDMHLVASRGSMGRLPTPSRAPVGLYLSVILLGGGRALPYMFQKGQQYRSNRLRVEWMNQCSTPQNLSHDESTCETILRSRQAAAAPPGKFYRRSKMSRSVGLLGPPREHSGGLRRNGLGDTAKVDTKAK